MRRGRLAGTIARRLLGLRARPADPRGRRLDRPRGKGLRLAAAVRGLPAHVALALRHRDRPEPLSGALPGRHPHRRVPDGAVAQGAPPAARQSLHRRRHRARQDHRGGTHRPRTAPAPEGERHRRCGATVGTGAVEGGAGESLRPCLRDSRPRVSLANAPRARLRRQPVAHAQPVPGIPQPPDRPELRGPPARVAGTNAAREPADSRRGPPRRACERREIRNRDQSSPARSATWPGASSTACSCPRHPTTATRTASRPCWSSWIRTVSPAVSRYGAKAPWTT